MERKSKFFKFFYLLVLLIGVCFYSSLSLSLRAEEAASDNSLETMPISLHGQVIFTSGDAHSILVEARKATHCPQGLCPVIGKAALASIRLKEEGPFTLYLNNKSLPLIIIATHQNDFGATRISHQTIENIEEFEKNILLSLDRPEKALR